MLAVTFWEVIIMVVLEAKNIYKSYKTGNKSIDVLNNVNFSLNEGERVAIIGPSGSGKSTLLNIMSGLTKPDKGTLLFREHNLSKMNETQLTSMRLHNFGFIFQSFHLVHSLNVLDNIILPVLAKKEAVDVNSIYSLCDFLGIKNRLDHFPFQLSGGEMQRVAIARAIVSKPKIIFSDEATGNLDEKNSVQVMEMLSNICRKNDISLVFVTHDISLTKYADRTKKFDFESGLVDV